MPTIYLSPSTQEFNNYYYSSGSEEFYMNLIADAMEPFLYASGISFVRNTPDMTAGSSIRASNAGNYDVHLALHSNASGGTAGAVTGSEAYYSPISTNGKRLADIIVNNLKLIYPNPNRVRAVSTSSLGEVTRTRAPAVLIEFAYHDNPSDAEWIKSNITAIAENVVLSLADYFGIPFVLPEPIKQSVVTTSGSSLNLRSGPAIQTNIIGKIPNGTVLNVYGVLPEWSAVEYGGQRGYVNNNYIRNL